MYEDQTYEVILNRLLDNCPSSVDKREGSIIYDALAPAAIELAKAYVAIDQFLIDTFASTATRPYLILRAEERGLSPKAATKAVVAGAFYNIPIEKGTRFFCGTKYFVTDYLIKQTDEYYVYALIAEEAGTDSNIANGNLVPANDITGLKRAEILEIVSYGEDEEDTESFRARYFENVRAAAFGGNITDYKEKCNTMNGIGGCRVTPVWNGAGTVLLTLISSSFGVVSNTRIREIQEAIMPLEYPSEGRGIAPIGHNVTVKSVESLTYDFKVNISVEEVDSTKYAYFTEKITNSIKNYLLDLRKSWENLKETENIVISVSQIVSRILQENPDILDVDYSTLTISETGTTGTAGQNMEVLNQKIPIFHSVEVKIKV